MEFSQKKYLNTSVMIAVQYCTVYTVHASPSHGAHGAPRVTTMMAKALVCDAPPTATGLVESAHGLV